MGNDGGSIPTRRELVKEAAKAPSASQLKEAQREQLEHFWTTCPLSHRELRPPIVSDSVGNLYNKDTILRFLIPGDDLEGIRSKADCEEILCGRVKSLRDVVEVKFEADGDAADTEEQKKKQFVCPVTNKALGPSVKSVYLVPCGHAFSEEAIREMKSDKCLQCNESYISENIIPILPTKESEKERLISRMKKLADQGLTHSLKKAPGSKKRKKAMNDSAYVKADSTAAVDGVTGKPSSILNSGPVSRNSTPVSSATSGIKNAATAMLTSRVLEEEHERTKRRKQIGNNTTLQSLFTSSSTKHKTSDGDFMTRGFTVPSGARR
ncbi:Replication termination factor 2 [Emydomyces testavorans]|uniref:Replication termination factor 2 n=1 Tax=Emydomyces testavorans TaxID=2070801 RepID=A0AAF0DIY8_9EURO|nr:Replication termination factor 2 [Emydomyces testavorans]